MNVDAILLSRYAHVENNALTVFNTFDRVLTSELPAQVAMLALSLIIHGHSSEAGTQHTIRVEVLNKSRKKIGELSKDFMFPGSEAAVAGMPLRAVQAMRIFGARFEEEGPYAFEVYIDETYHTAVTFLVTKSEQ